MKMLTIKEIADYLHISAQTVRQKVKALQQDKLIYIVSNADNRIRLSVEQVGTLIATYYKSVYNVYCEEFGIKQEERQIMIPTSKGQIQRLKRANGTEVFYIRNLPLFYDKQGNEVMYKSKKFTSREEAEQERTRLIIERDKQASRKLSQENERYGIDQQLLNMRYIDYCIEFVDKKEIRASTKISYISAIKVLEVVLSGILVSELTAGVLNGALDKIKVQKKAVSIVLKGSLTSLYKRDVIDKSIIDKLDYKLSKSKPKQVLTQSQLVQVLELAKQTNYYYLIRLLFLSGMRIGEVIALTRSDINLCEQGLIEITINKTASRSNNGVIIEAPKTKAGNRVIYLNDPILYNWFNSCVTSLVFKSNTGSLVNHATIWRCMQRIGQKLGIEISPHTARHTYISMLVDKGINIFSIAKQVGHNNPTLILKVYGDTVRGQKEEFQDITII